MSHEYDQSYFYIDFSTNNSLTDEDKLKLENIQQTYRPLERVEYLNEFKMYGKITSDEFETMTGTPYSFD